MIQSLLIDYFKITYPTKLASLFMLNSFLNTSTMFIPNLYFKEDSLYLIYILQKISSFLHLKYELYSKFRIAIIL